MNELVIEELKYFIPMLLIGFFAFIYYRERDTTYFRKYATFWPRFWAPSIDGAILWPITGLAPFLFVYSGFWSDAQQLVVYSILSFIHPCYSIFFHGHYGATLGKMACKLRVIDADTQKPMTFKQAMFRDSVPVFLMGVLLVWGLWVNTTENATDSLAFYAIPFIYFLWFLAEVFTMLTNRRRRAIHDFIAGTVVVRYDWD